MEDFLTFQLNELPSVEDNPTGAFRALVQQIEVRNAKGQIWDAGAVGDGMAVQISSYAHNSLYSEHNRVPSPPVGAGRFHPDRELGYFVIDGTFDLNDPRGMAAYQNERFLMSNGIPSQWSMGYRVNSSRPDGPGPRILSAEVKEGSRVPGGTDPTSATVALNEDISTPPDPASDETAPLGLQLLSPVTRRNIAKRSNS